MRRLAAAPLLLVAVTAPAVASGQSLLASATAGGGWDSNLSGSSGATPVSAGGYATASVSVGGAIEPSDRDELSLEIGGDASRYPAYPDLDIRRPWVEIGWLHDLGESITVRIAPAAGMIFAGTRARGGWDAGAIAAARLRLGSATALRASAGYRHRAADDPAFASDSFRGRGGIERDLWRGSTVAAAYTVDVGQDTFYAPYTATGTIAPLATRATSPGSSFGGGGGGGGGGWIAPGGRYGSPVSTFGTSMVAYAGDRVAHSIGLRLTQRFPAGFTLDASWTYEIVRGEVQDYTAHLATLELAWRR